jgi:hypothetical protein
VTPDRLPGQPSTSATPADGTFAISLLILLRRVALPAYIWLEPMVPVSSPSHTRIRISRNAPYLPSGGSWVISEGSCAQNIAGLSRGDFGANSAGACRRRAGVTAPTQPAASVRWSREGTLEDRKWRHKDLKATLVRSAEIEGSRLSSAAGIPVN